MVVDGFDDFLLLHVDGQLLSELVDGLGAAELVVALGDEQVGVGDVLYGVGLVLVLGELYFLLLLDHLQRFVSEFLEGELASH